MDVLALALLDRAGRQHDLQSCECLKREVNFDLDLPWRNSENDSTAAAVVYDLDLSFCMA